MGIEHIMYGLCLYVLLYAIIIEMVVNKYVDQMNLSTFPVAISI